ncbi:MAG: DinB family protein [Chloroflexi bacterium]|nr:DinB family protein [Chloroflexota bacterium]
MFAETAELHRSITMRLQQVVDCLNGLSEAQLNFVPPLPGANSPYVLAAHTLGNARAWVLGIACGRDVGRDRPAEFRATGADAAALREGLARLEREMADALEELTPTDLDRRFVPAKVLWGENEPREISVRSALLQVVEHASLHLGHLHVTRDLALAAG